MSSLFFPVVGIYLGEASGHMSFNKDDFILASPPFTALKMFEVDKGGREEKCFLTRQRLFPSGETTNCMLLH